jgi:large repetitive protein
MFRKKNLIGAFTLIELLVVISIISLLSSIVLASLNSARDKGRMAAGLKLASSLATGMGAEAVGIWNLDEGTGAVAYNSSGKGTVNGVITGATWVSGPNNKPALAFTAGRRVDLGSVTIDVNVTVAAWIQASSGGAGPVFSNRGAGLYFGISQEKFFTYYNNSSAPAMSSLKSIVDNKWHHIVWTSNGSKETMYIDGQFDSSMSQTRNSADTGTGYIGYDAGNGTYFSGDVNVSQVAVYTETLGLNEIQNLYASGLRNFLAKQ